LQRPVAPVAAAPEQLLQAVLERAAAFSPRELLCVLWATAELPLLPQQPVVQALLENCLQPAVLQQYTGVDLTPILWCLARMQHRIDLDRQQLQQRGSSPAIQQQEPQRQWLHKQRQQRQQAVYNNSSSDALVTLQTMQPILDALLLQLPVLPSHGAAAALRCIAVLGLRPSAPWVGHVLQHCQLQLASMKPSSLVLLAAAVADLGYLPNSDWLSSFYAASQPVIAAVSSGGSSSSGTTSSSSSSSSADSRQLVSTLSTQQLEALAGAVAKISRLRSQPFPGQKPPSGWLSALAQSSAAALAAAHAAGTLTAGQLSFWGRVMNRFVSLAGEPWQGPGRDWWLQYLAYSQPLLRAATPLQLCNFVEVLAQKQQQRQIGQLPEAWLQSYLQATAAFLPSGASSSGAASTGDTGSSSSVGADGAHNIGAGAAVSGAATVADLVSIGKALVQLGVLPSAGWRSAWLLAVERLDASMTPSWGNTFSWTADKFRRMEAEQQQQQQQQQQGLRDPALSSCGTSADQTAAAAGDAAAVVPSSSSSSSSINSSSLSSGSDWAELADAFSAAAAEAAEPQSVSQQQLQQLSQGSNELSATYDDSCDEAAEPSPQPTATSVSAQDDTSDLSVWEKPLYEGAAEAGASGLGQVLDSLSDGSSAVPCVAGTELAQQLHDKFWRQLGSMDDMQQQLDISLRRLQQPQQPSL
jgi:hypothetical protein